MKVFIPLMLLFLAGLVSVFAVVKHRKNIPDIFFSGSWTAIKLLVISAVMSFILLSLMAGTHISLN